MKLLLTSIGLISLGFGIVGIFLPLLPTTPFMLLTAWCFARSSSKFNHWLLNHKIFGAYIVNYREHRGMSFQHKIISLTMLWGVISYSIFLTTHDLWIKLLLLAVAIAVTTHIGKLKTIKPKLGISRS